MKKLRILPLLFLGPSLRLTANANELDKKMDSLSMNEFAKDHPEIIPQRSSSTAEESLALKLLIEELGHSGESGRRAHDDLKYMSVIQIRITPFDLPEIASALAGAVPTDSDGMMQYDPIQETISVRRALLVELGLGDQELGEDSWRRAVHWLAPLFVHELRHADDDGLRKEPRTNESEVSALAAEMGFLAERDDYDPDWLETLPIGLRKRYDAELTAWRRTRSAESLVDNVSSLIAEPGASLNDPAAPGKQLEAVRGVRLKIDAIGDKLREEPAERLKVEAALARLRAAEDFWKDPKKIAYAQGLYRRRDEEIVRSWRQYQRRWAFKWIDSAEDEASRLSSGGLRYQPDKNDRKMLDIDTTQARDHARLAGWDAEPDLKRIENSISAPPSPAGLTPAAGTDELKP